MLAPWHTGKVIRMVDETPTTRRFWIEATELPALDFKPGQFVTIDLPIHEKANKRWRSYSIASWPDGTHRFELIIVRLEEGAGTTYLFNEIKVGSELKFRGPQGVFVLPASLDRDLFLICTGTGVAPFRSMVQHIRHQSLPHKNIHLIFGCRTRKDLLYYEEFLALEKELPSFHYHPVLSREEWSGNQGHVHEVYKRICKEAYSGNTGDTPVPAFFYLCGWRAMIDEAKANLLAAGYDKKSIESELYG